MTFCGVKNIYSLAVILLLYSAAPIQLHLNGTSSYGCIYCWYSLSEVYGLFPLYENHYPSRIH